MEMETMVKLFKEGQDAAREMLKPGQVFQGSWQLGDAAGYGRESDEFRAFTLGAYNELRAYDIYCNDSGVITRLDVKC